jgi:hypothetical protein
MGPDPSPRPPRTPNIGSAATAIAWNSTKRIDSDERISAVTLTERERKKRSAVVSRKTDDRKRSPPPPRR